MSRRQILCISRDRSTRATLTLALTDAPVSVAVAREPAVAIDRLERDPVDAVVIDARTISDVPAVRSTLESIAPTLSIFAYWDTDGGETTPILTELPASSPATAPATDLTQPILDSITPSSTADRRPELVETIRCELADAMSPRTVEQVLRTTFTASDAFVFAWAGEYDRGEQSVVPWITDPEATSWPTHRTFRVGNGSNPLLERALYTQTLQTASTDATRSIPFVDRARERDVQAVAVSPLATCEERYGVLVVYAPTALSTAERETIRSVAEVASHVLETIAIRGQLEQQEQTLHRYERLVETAGDGIYVLDAAGHIMTINDAIVEMTGYTREGLLGEHADLLFDESTIDRAETAIGSLLRSNDRSTTIEAPLETKSGARIPCEVQLTVLVHDDEFSGCVGVVRDVTERKRNERRLREQNERLDAFARIVSHDLRNPLGIAQGYLELVAETESLEHLPTARRSLDRMEAIIDDVLAIARDGAWASETTRVDLESAATEAWNHVSTGGAMLSIVDTMTLTADRSRLLRVFENLFRNAIEHGCDGDESEHELTVRVGTLEFGACSLATDEIENGTGGGLEADDPCGFFVADDGAGLPDEFAAAAELFDPSVSTDADGLGIGLWVVREVAAGHDWRVTATESEAGGARFEFVTVAGRSSS
ncbi:PAS domain S-box protein [Natrialba sp. PRR66]|uniref:PAS domain S-box protein n=1 Tax=Natrialba sp. PRR66 TaxID=3098146 RepID=UPI002B1DB9D6|nr:PAS domain S-box protein [Natrialba sp. PRR66]